MYTHIYTCMRTHECMHARAHTHAHIYAHTHTPTHECTHARTHTCTHVYSVKNSDDSRQYVQAHIMSVNARTSYNLYSDILKLASVWIENIHTQMLNPDPPCKIVKYPTMIQFNVHSIHLRSWIDSIRIRCGMRSIWIQR